MFSIGKNLASIAVCAHYRKNAMKLKITPPSRNLIVHLFLEFICICIHIFEVLGKGFYYIFPGQYWQCPVSLYFIN